MTFLSKQVRTIYLTSFPIDHAVVSQYLHSKNKNKKLHYCLSNPAVCHNYTLHNNF